MSGGNTKAINDGTKKRDIILLLILQLVFVVLYAVFLKYDEEYEARIYPMFQDVHAMIFVGFGFLMTFMKRYSFSGVGFNFLLAALIVQWAILCEGFFSMNDEYKIEVSILSILRADVASAAVLISMGALLGRTSYMQLIVMGIIEIAVFSANSALGEKLMVADAGDSIFVHAFGAYFGLAVSFVLGKRKQNPGHEDSSSEESSYNSDMFAMIGTIFLWIFWPSFNSVELKDDEQHRAIINTYLALASSCVTAYALSAALSSDHKFDMVHVQNSTLAGGVAIGASANLMVQPWGALLVGSIAGVLSVCGYALFTPWIRRALSVVDTCGVHNLHGMPGVLAAVVAALMAGIATEDQYKMKLYSIYPARASNNTLPTAEYPFLEPGIDRTAAQQAGYQLLAITLTLLIAIITGLITGVIISCPMASRISSQNENIDDPYWLIHEHHDAPIKVRTISGVDNQGAEIQDDREQDSRF